MKESSSNKDILLLSSDLTDIDKSKNDLSTTDDHIRKIHSLNKYFVNHKNTTSFKLKLIKDINFMERKVILFTIIKLLLGFIFLAIPLLIIILFIYNDYSERSQYIFFPYFLSLSIIMGSLMILLVIKLGDACRNYGIFIVSWERIYMFKIFKGIIIGLFILWFLFLCEEFVINFNLLREKVAQSNNWESSSKVFNEGTYSIRLLFILLLWDTEKDKDGEYNHKSIGYFEYEDTFFKDFHASLSKLLVPIISACIFYLVKIFFIKTKREIIYCIFILVTLFNCFYFVLSNPSDDDNSKKKLYQDQEYFKNNPGKYCEIIPITIIIISLIILNVKRCIIDLIHKKFYPFRHREKNLFIFYLVMTSFVLNTAGYLLFLGLLYVLYFEKIESDLSIYAYNTYWIIIYVSFTLILIGYSFPFGHYCFKLVYYPIAYETYDHHLKNNFYVNCSGNLRNSFNYYQKKEKEKRTQSIANTSF